MSVSAAIGRVQEIQTTLTHLTDPTLDTAAGSPSSASAAPAEATGTPSASLASFGQALAGALGSTSTALPSAGVGLASAGVGLAATGAVPASGNLAASGGVTGDEIAADAQKYVGVPYLWGGTDPSKGLDCSGFVQRVYQDLGISLPRVVHDQMQAGTPVASLADAKPGDLLVSFGGEHVAIYLGNGKAIDAPVPGQTIQVRDAWEQYGNLTAIRRIVPESATGSAAGVAGSAAGVAGLDPSQQQYAQDIVNRVAQLGLPAQAAVDAVSTALQESSLRMYWNPKVAGSQALAPEQSAVGTDGYSVGLFQQQVNGNAYSWGTVSDAMDPVASTDMFLNRLTAIPGWQNMPVTAADQAVQGSAYPDAYAKWEAEARQIVSALSPTGA
ncbi:C40 family peptidase [Sinomonas terrae]|uniref:C40 family peptidase n=1 Tax=Sinomonas terrae TaxID=2908838 RepID=A0ABS9TVZ1_9MICC|nr:C40 family peptidase [Sinomonas terrae]MCH6468525.1 C40 family peptidase [Sinomonas terrae]